MQMRKAVVHRVIQFADEMFFVFEMIQIMNSLHIKKNIPNKCLIQHPIAII